MKHLGLQLWTIRDVIKDEEQVKFAFSEAAKYGYDEIETAGFPIPPERLNQIARENGLTIISSHIGWNEIEADPDGVIARSKMFGSKFIGSGYRMETKEEVLAFIEKANAFGRKCAGAGIKFVYHNHSQEFMKTSEGRTRYSYLMEGLDFSCTSLELDTYWAQHGGMDVRALLEQLRGKIDVLHLKDMAAHLYRDGENPDITEIGNGNLNFAGIIPLAESLDVEHYIVEQDRNWKVSPLESAKESAAYLRANFGF
ncbi:MAG: sugar phosphate isomerase/epimerase [Clostridia bacterium]|nr:sugar phosphate isomerase/epimerase [Clostridia bacterium]